MSGDGAPNVIGGAPVNFVAAGVTGATIGGGGSSDYYHLPLTNGVASDFGTVGGGGWNQIQDNCIGATIGGGNNNQISSSCDSSTIGGGSGNGIGTNASM